MIRRQLTSSLLGSRQVGKPSHYFDLEHPSDLAKLANLELYPSDFTDSTRHSRKANRTPSSLSEIVSVSGLLAFS
jgi:hypothetical protein